MTFDIDRAEIYYFRLKPFGILFWGENDGSITLHNNVNFSALQRHVELHQPDSKMAGSNDAGLNRAGGPTKRHVSRQCIDGQYSSSQRPQPRALDPSDHLVPHRHRRFPTDGVSVSPPNAACAPAATRVVSVQGNVTWSLVGSTTLSPAKLNDLLCVGDTVSVGTKSRAVLRLPNETTIPLDQNTVFQLKEAISDKEPTLIELIQGAIHVITRTPKPFKVNTPYMNAAVEGTEFYVGVDSEEAKVAVIEGKVNVSNEQGALLLTDNEAATARKGQAPQKTLTIKPRDAVQWALYYPPVIRPARSSTRRAP